MSSSKKRKRSLKSDVSYLFTEDSIQFDNNEYVIKKKKNRSKSLMKKKDKQLLKKKNSVDENTLRKTRLDSFRKRTVSMARGGDLHDEVVLKARALDDIYSPSLRRKLIESRASDAEPELVLMKAGVFGSADTGRIVKATIQGFVKYVILDLTVNFEVIEEFLMCHCKLMKSNVFLTHLMKLFNRDFKFRDKAVKGQIFELLIYWMDNYPYHFQESLKENLMIFIEGMEDMVVPQLDTRWYLNEITRRLEMLPPEPATMRILTFQPSTSTLLDFEVSLITESITILFQESFSNLNVSNIFATGEELDILSKEANMISNWVSMECMMVKDDPDLSKAVISRFISICTDLRNINNLCGAFAVYCGLSIYEVDKIEGWSNIGDKNYKAWKRITRYCDPASQFKYIREHQERGEAPLIPHFGTFLI
eukprot:TRINITY_DN3582_c0_g1_i1.p1 TRINITY_DN3582_c0_g1~~TRINITY_DN3582_c0_g1_i1.p1  ORF type:complete len:422 (+),score=82.75 TRINITY_DN3582_c0_g1_i1:64-1329(+)